MEMFCYQCEQTAKGTGCTIAGVCGKQPDIAALQDIIVFQTKGVGWLAHQLRQAGHKDTMLDRYIIDALFTTVTNVDFDAQQLLAWITKGAQMRSHAQERCKASEIAVSTPWPSSATYSPLTNLDSLLNDHETIEGMSVLSGPQSPDIRSLQQLLIYGLKGMAAYANHAAILGKTDDTIFRFFHEALAALNNPELPLDELISLNMRCGETNIKTMEILDNAHTERYGHPQPTSVSTGHKQGPAIVITGHDLYDLEQLLKQTEGTGVNIYTHGEMLPAHGYPELKKYTHLAGHFGTAWQNQQSEFDNQPVVFLFTTNCIQKPRESYKSNVFTKGLVGWPNVAHIMDDDYSEAIAKAINLGGWKQGSNENTLMTGFGHNAVLGVADKVIEGVKSGAIKHFFLVGGCDGAKPGRNYYTEFVEQAPADTVILTLACGKFRFNHLQQQLGTIGGIPRLLDVGQCNDAYSAIKIALALSNAFGVGVNDLPLSLILSWYEQKAVVILLSLLHLGIKGIRLGPTLPAFVTPTILDFLVKTFDIKPISTAQQDLATILNK